MGAAVAESDTATPVNVVFGVGAVGRLAVGQIVAIVLYFCPGRGLLLSGKRQMASMDGSLLIWLAALIPLHATLTRYQSQYSNSLRFVPLCTKMFSTTEKNRASDLGRDSLGIFFLYF